MLKFASAYRVKPVRAVGEHLPFKDETFDFILMTVIICFLDSPEEVILEAMRVLRYRGELAVCIVPRDSSWGQGVHEEGKGGSHLLSSRPFLCF